MNDAKIYEICLLFSRVESAIEMNCLNSIETYESTDLKIELLRLPFIRLNYI